MTGLLRRITSLAALSAVLAFVPGCQTPRPSKYTEFEKPLVCTVSGADLRGRSTTELAAEVAYRVWYTVRLDMRGDPAKSIDGWVMHSEMYFPGRVVSITDRAIEMVAVQSEHPPGGVTISLRFPWAVDRAVWLESSRWYPLGDVSGNLVQAWPEIARDTAAGAPLPGPLGGQAVLEPNRFMNFGYCGTGYDEFRTERFAAAR